MAVWFGYRFGIRDAIKPPLSDNVVSLVFFWINPREGTAGRERNHAQGQGLASYLHHHLSLQDPHLQSPRGYYCSTFCIVRPLAEACSHIEFESLGLGKRASSGTGTE